MAHSLKVLDKAKSYIMLQKSYLLFVAFVHVGGLRMSMGRRSGRPRQNVARPPEWEASPECGEASGVGGSGVGGSGVGGSGVGGLRSGRLRSGRPPEWEAS